MNTKPIWIEKFNRPAGTEIKHIGNGWYLYERLSVYDREKKRKRKKSGKCLGAITESGLIPSKRMSPLNGMDAGEIENLEYGATAFLLKLTASMRKRLAESPRAEKVKLQKFYSLSPLRPRNPSWSRGLIVLN